MVRRPLWLSLVGAAAFVAGATATYAEEEPSPLSSYKLPAAERAAWDYDAAVPIRNYAELVYHSYTEAAEEAEKLRAAIGAFLAEPGEKTMAAARAAWINARPAYLQTEAFRFYDGPIDFADPATGRQGPESRLNAWPLNEAFIDSVAGAPEAGLINKTDLPINRASILENDQMSDESDVTTGWHAIEFLLWGQDQSEFGPGERSYTEYVPGERDNDRRRQYLQIATDLLVEDIASLKAAWAPNQPDNYRASFLALDQREALGRILNGIANLVGFEMASERLAVALDSGAQEDEQSCFSDTTHQDLFFNLRGVRNVWFGDAASHSGPGLDILVAAHDPALNKRVIDLLNRSEAALIDVDRPFDRVLATQAGSPERAEAEAAVDALYDLDEALQEVGRNLGVLVIVAGS